MAAISNDVMVIFSSSNSRNIMDEYVVRLFLISE